MKIMLHQRENISKKIEITSLKELNTNLSLKSTITEMKIYQKSSTGLRISEFEVTSSEIQFMKQKEKRIRK